MIQSRSSSARFGRRWRTRIVAVVALTVAAAPSATAVAASHGAGSSATTSSISSKIDKEVRADLSTHPTGSFLVEVKGKADLSGVPGTGRRADRVAAVYRTKKTFADQAQASLRDLLSAQRVPYTPFWISNLIRVTGDQSLANRLAARPDVVRVLPDERHAIPKPKPDKQLAEIRSVEWNIAQIRADRVWSDFADTGSGIVVANIDTGVDYTHPALVNRYRGNQGGGQFDHNYNWYDPSQICGTPSTAPCDNVGHGTHTMGTMLGDDGQGNQIGVAPGATWIAAKGCEDLSCSDTALLSSGQWVVAPTDLSGQNPRPDLAPNIVNNSWGGVPDDPWYSDVVDTWIAAGLFPVFANGNAGSGCDTADSPGDYVSTYSAGAYDSAGDIAWFSSRGPGVGTEIKPNLAAPGVAVRSSVPGGMYESLEGTSMAAPHVSGVVALIWAASPTLVGDIAATRQVLDASAVDTPDNQCGGTDADNNVFGEGKLDAYAAVARAPRGPTGGLVGSVVSGGQPVADATVTVTGAWNTTIRTGADGHYAFGHLPVGGYTVTVTKFGYLTRASSVTITQDQTTVQDFDLPPAPHHQLSGTVRETDGTPVVGTAVTVAATPIAPATTDGAGHYVIPNVPDGEYDVTADFGRWLQPVTRHVTVSGDIVLDFTLPAKVDGYGYTAAPARPVWVDTPTVVPLSGDDAQASVNLPFPFTFYGKTYKSANVSTNGYLTFEGDAWTFGNAGIPSTAQPNAAVYALWDDLYVDSSSTVRSGTVGDPPHRQFAIEWRDVAFLADTSKRVSVEIVFTETGGITLQYSGIDPDDPLERGSSATVGLENADGTVGLQYSSDQPYLSDDVAITLRVPNTGLLRGTVTDANDRKAIAGATVTARGVGLTRQGGTDDAGFYQLQLPFGSYTVTVQKIGYVNARAPILLGSETIAVKDFALAAPRVQVDPAALEIVAPAGQQRTRTLDLHNTGTAPATWETEEAAGGMLAGHAVDRAAVRAIEIGDPNARNSRAVRRAAAQPASVSAGTQGAGDVLKSWPANELGGAWGVGYDGTVWLSDYAGRQNAQYSVDGVFGRQVPAQFGEWPADMALLPGQGLMCQVTVGGDNNIRCWNRSDGSVVATISGPWNRTSQRGLAYRADDDTFYVGGWNEGIVYHIKGLSYPDAGAVISQCSPSDWAISGLAYSPRGVLWEASNSDAERLTALNPDTCQAVQSMPDPDPNQYTGAGLEIDQVGNLWLIAQNQSGGRNTAYLVDSGIPSYSDVPWLSEDPSSGTLAAGESTRVKVTVSTVDLAPGVYAGTVFVASDSPRQPVIGVPVKLVVPKYQTAVDSGSGTAGVDSQQDRWGPDQAFSTGGFGYLGSSSVVSTTEPITGTPDQWLYRTARQGAYEYRFDGLPSGTYQVDLDFAELSDIDPNTRVFDVVLERQIVLPGFDIIGENGSFTAVRHSFTVQVTDGQLNARLLSRLGQTLINGVRVTERPDLTTG